MLAWFLTGLLKEDLTVASRFLRITWRRFARLPSKWNQPSGVLKHRLVAKRKWIGVLWTTRLATVKCEKSPASSWFLVTVERVILSFRAAATAPACCVACSMLLSILAAYRKSCWPTGWKRWSYPPITANRFGMNHLNGSQRICDLFRKFAGRVGRKPKARSNGWFTTSGITSFRAEHLLILAICNCKR